MRTRTKNSALRCYAVLLLTLVAVCQVWAGERLILVEPIPRLAQTTPVALADVRTSNTRGGRVFDFSSVKAGDDDPLLKKLSQSPAVQKALDLLDLAHRLGPAPSQEWLADRGPLPIWVIPAGGTGKGPGMITMVPLRITADQKTCEMPYLLVLESLSLPGKETATPQDLDAAAVLVPVVCHEIFHAIQAMLYRERYLLLDILALMPGVPHDSPVETDPQLALKEGFAEFGELWLAGQFPQEFTYTRPEGSVRPALQAFSQEMRKKRITLAERNRYIFQNNGRVKDGQLKSGNTDLATEGVIASLLFTLVGHAEWNDPMRVLFSAMAHEAPTSFFELISTLLRENKAQAETVRRILLEYTCYTIQSPAALKHYETYYLTRKAFLVGAVKREEFEKARQAWQTWKQDQLARIAAGRPLGEAVPHPLIVTNREGYSLDLNDEQSDRLTWHLEAFVPPDQKAQAARLAAGLGAKILARRQELGSFASIDDLRETIPGWLLQRFQAGFRRYLQKAEQRLDSEVTRRRTLAGYE